MYDPLISIIVPIYNVELFLEECVNSLIKQTYTNLEIILVDDGSPDRCPLICDEYKKNDNRIVVIHKENGGLVSARKAGVLAAKGDYISFVDGDDFVAINHYKNIVDAITLFDADIITTDYSSYNNGVINNHLQLLRYGFLEKEEIRNSLQDKMISGERFFCFNILPSVWTKCIKKELAFKYQMMIPDSIVMGEDSALSYPCIKNANSICHIDENGYYYRIRDNSISRSYDSHLLERIKCLIDYLCVHIDYKSNQMIDYISYLTTLVIVNSFKGEKNIKNSFNDLIGFMTDKKIKYALDNSRVPNKFKLLFASIYNEHFFSFLLFRMIYLTRH